MKHISRLMALHIFSDQVQNWSDFGPSFPDLPIVKCMRHGGSGTHQTLIDTVFRGDANLKNVTRTAGPNFVWHYKSSSDLTRDCVAFYDGGIGYVDADKVMFRSKVAKGIHQLMYGGAAPSRNDVASGKYNFWAAQQCFLDTTLGCYGPQDLSIIDQIQTKAGDPSFLTFAGFAQRAYFWATQDEMEVQKIGGGFAYPTRK
jgi:ABC-type phosphate transport system substrate-binding protein